MKRRADQLSAVRAEVFGVPIGKVLVVRFDADVPQRPQVATPCVPVAQAVVNVIDLLEREHSSSMDGDLTAGVKARYGDVMTSDEGWRRAAADDRSAIEEVVRAFFAAFASGADCVARLDGLRQLFLPEAVIVRTCGGVPTVYGVDDFITPRMKLLSSGDLTEFREWELSGRTDVFGDIAQHFCSYAKTGVQHGAPFTGRGMKTLQLVRTSAGWRISAAAWDDERDGLALEEHSSAVSA